MTEYAPEHGDIGSWTRLPDGGVGQVWAIYADRDQTRRVWVADGERYVDIPLADLVDPAAAPVVEDQGGLFDVEEAAS